MSKSGTIKIRFLKNIYFKGNFPPKISFPKFTFSKIVNYRIRSFFRISFSNLTFSRMARYYCLRNIIIKNIYSCFTIWILTFLIDLLSIWFFFFFYKKVIKNMIPWSSGVGRTQAVVEILWWGWWWWVKSRFLEWFTGTDATYNWKKF